MNTCPSQARDLAQEGHRWAMEQTCVRSCSCFLKRRSWAARRTRRPEQGLRLEGVSHHTTERRRKNCRRPPIDSGTAMARQGMRIINAKKSKYYNAALENFEQARRCYERAGSRRLAMRCGRSTRRPPPQDRFMSVLRKSLPTWFPVRSARFWNVRKCAGYATG